MRRAGEVYSSKWLVLVAGAAVLAGGCSGSGGGEPAPAGVAGSAGAGGSGGVAASAGSAATLGGATTLGGSGSSPNASAAGVSGGGSSGQTGGGSGGTMVTGGGASVAGGGGSGGQGGSAGSGGGSPSDPNKRRLLLRDEGNSAVHFVDLGDRSHDWHQAVPVGRDLQLIGGGRFMIGTENGYQERSLSDGAVVKDVTSFPGTVAAHRLENGNTLLCGVAFHGGQGIVLVEVTQAAAVARQISYPGDYVRLVRPSPNDHFLVAAEDKVFEGDAQGNVGWQVTVQGHAMPHAWEALHLASGDVLVAGGYAASLQIFGADQKLKQTITGGEGVNPFFFADVQVMPSGSYVVANWQGHGTGLGQNGLQVVEYAPTGELVWSWKQDASFVSSLQHLVVLDGLDLEKLQVEDAQTGVLGPAN